MTPDLLRDRLLALFSLHGAADAAVLADQALLRFSQLSPQPEGAEAMATVLHGIARLLLDADPARSTASEAVEEPEFDPATRKALRACFAQLGTDASKLILGYYEFGSAGGGDTGAGRQRRRQQLAARLGMTPDALRDRAHEIRATLEAGVQARLAANGAGP